MQGLRVLIWNVAGMTKRLDEKWELVLKQDVFGIVETWLEEGSEVWVKDMLKDFDIEVAWARKENSRGRAKGGLIVGVRKGVVEKVATVSKSKELIAIDLMNKKDRCRFLVTYMREDRLEDWREIQRLAEDDRISIVVGGDFNARIGEEEGWTEEEVVGGWKEDRLQGRRKARDKVVNREGEEMLEEIKHGGFYVLNGSVEGDEEGDFTYIGPRGRTTLDYVLVNEHGKQTVERMEIGSRIDSDHMPLVMVWSWISGGKVMAAVKESVKIMDWSEEGKEKFCGNLREEVIGEIKEWGELVELIRKEIVYKEVKRRRGGEAWMNGEVREERRKLRALLRKCKREEASLKEYYTKRKEYKDLIRKSIAAKEDEMLEEVRRDRTGRKFWEMVKRGRNYRVSVSEKITKEAWLEHFASQLGAKVHTGEEREVTVAREREVEEWLTEAVSMEEMEGVIRRLKKKKAAGPDGVGNEAWIFGWEKLRTKVLEIFNEIGRLRRLPKQWKEGIIAPLHKKGDRDQAENYRGITLMDTGYKIFAEIMRKRIEKEIGQGKGLDDTQMGFREGRGTMEAIFVLKNAVEEALRIR